ncbi:MAG TPA: ubiquinone/menaquinone biosynthesis methyltransferase [Thermodesulfobacteriota bacterium]|nr:ubiquinone/menaquinone biosynthesis methyltransferase [Thermodesulfobacteriota bacterium]
MPDTVNLFDKVARRYDSLNTFFSMGMDRLWRRRLAVAVSGSRTVLDIATGTGEVAIETVDVLPEARVFGIDPSSEMLLLARKKIISRGLSKRITLARSRAEELPFKDGSFDAVTIAFGIRNTIDPALSLSEMRRVLRPGGKAAVLEFAIPRQRLFAPLYLFYFKNILPLVGSLFGTRREYKYLSDSTSAFPQREKFLDLMKESGLEPEKSAEMMLGIVILYTGVKR